MSEPRMTRSLGTMLAELTSPNIGTILAKCGFEFVIVDMEHGPFTSETAAMIISGARGTGITVIVRVADASRGPITRLLDMGADGILVPMVNTVADARAVVNATKYAPVGTRGVSVTRAHTDYGVDDLVSYQTAANSRVKTWIQVETAEALAHVDDLARTSGIDAIIVGPNDLQSDIRRLGLPPSTLDDAIVRVGRAAAEAGIESGIITSDRRLISRAESEGLSILGFGSELAFLLSGARSAVAALDAVER